MVVAHLTKDESSRLVNRVSGAGAFVNAARSVLALALSPDDPDGEQGRERVLVHVSSNWGVYAPSLAARVESREVDLDDGSRTNIGHLNITGDSDVSVEDLQRTTKDENSSADVEEAILAALEDGARASIELKAKVASEQECGKRTVERAAGRMAAEGEIVITSGGFPRKTTWALPGRATDDEGTDESPVAPTTDAITQEPTVAPSTNTRRGVTDSYAVVTGDSAPDSRASRASRATLARAIARGAPACCCAHGPDELTEDGRCSRCHGVPR